MQIAVKVETGFNCNWRNIEPLQPEGFKGQTANEKETLKNSIVKNGFHDAFERLGGGCGGRVLRV